MNPLLSKILLIRELLPTEDLRNIVLYIIYVDSINDFEYGRVYQIVVDRSKNIKETKCNKRRFNVEAHMRAKVDHQIICEGLSIICDTKIKPESNEWYDVYLRITNEQTASLEKVDISTNISMYYNFYTGR